LSNISKRPLGERGPHRGHAYHPGTENQKGSVAALLERFQAELGDRFGVEESCQNNDPEHLSGANETDTSLDSHHFQELWDGCDLSTHDDVDGRYDFVLSRASRRISGIIRLARSRIRREIAPESPLFAVPVAKR
jgi:hypothetical protein